MPPLSFRTVQHRTEAPNLTDRFLIPPFSVLDGRSGPWQDRKRRWLTLGIQSELGRGSDGGNLTYVQGNGQDEASQKILKSGPKKRSAADTFGSGRPGDLRASYLPDNTGDAGSGTSIFDPVLCELVYRWFAPPGGIVLDPFAGGSVRGIVAAACGLNYLGIDLSAEQIAANRSQWETIGEKLGADNRPRWAVGDSLEILNRPAPMAPADLIFTCPPYGDLEVYSTNPADLSRLSVGNFHAAIGVVMRLTYARLADNRFSVWVVGDYRDSKSGNYTNFPGATINAALAAGFSLYNEAILLTAIGSLPLRTGRQFAASRKLGKGHQNVLVFVKGSGRMAANACANVDVYEDIAPSYGTGQKIL